GLARELSEDPCKERSEPKTGKSEAGGQARSCATVGAELGNPGGTGARGKRDGKSARDAREELQRDGIGKDEYDGAKRADTDREQDRSTASDLVGQPTKEEGCKHRA